MKRKLFCELSPATYKISVLKCRLLRHLGDAFSSQRFAKERSKKQLEVIIYSGKSLIRRKLGDVDPALQENKAVNLSISAPKVSGILIKPGETFSFWHLVGSVTEKKGYNTGLILEKGMPGKGIGGGMCQFTNLIHWLVLHSPLSIVEHHHHDALDLFPDYGRQIPFGTGTSIYYNYLDYRVTNDTEHTFQLVTYVTDTHLCAELRCGSPLDVSYHVKAEDERFVKREDGVYRTGKVYRECYDKSTGRLLERKLIKENNARLMYEIDDSRVEEEQGQ